MCDWKFDSLFLFISVLYYRHYHSFNKLIPMCCSHEKSSEFRWDDYDEFDKAGQQGETKCESSDERQSVQSESAV